MKKRTLIIGQKNSGKTTLAHELDHSVCPITKKANLVYGPTTIDVPAPYLESPWMHKHIIALQQKANEVFMLLPLNCQRLVYPPGFAKVFRIPVFGIITYVQSESSLWEKAEQRIRMIGIETPIESLDLKQQADFERIDHLRIRKEG